MLEKLKTPAVVLSYGRSGSVLVAHNIARKLGTLPVYIKDNSPIDFLIGHSHLLRTDWNAQRIFVVRSSLDCALSFLLAEAQQTYHVWATDKFTPQPRELDPSRVVSLLLGYKSWHQHYGPTLCVSDSVIEYNKLRSMLSPIQVYQPTFSDKETLVLNYNTIKSVCSDLVTECDALMQVFVNHQNQVDVYQLAAD